MLSDRFARFNPNRSRLRVKLIAIVPLIANERERASYFVDKKSSLASYLFAKRQRVLEVSLDRF